MVPKGIKVKKSSQTLALSYDDAEYELSYEFLRVNSPSAEVRGHGGGEGTLQHGKKDVSLLAVSPVGNYALKLTFDDGHDTGLYDWNYLRHLCLNQDSIWAEYLARLEREGKRRESATINFKAL